MLHNIFNSNTTIMYSFWSLYYLQWVCIFGFKDCEPPNPQIYLGHLAHSKVYYHFITKFTQPPCVCCVNNITRKEILGSYAILFFLFFSFGDCVYLSSKRIDGERRRKLCRYVCQRFPPRRAIAW